MLSASLGLSVALFAIPALDLYVDPSAPGCATGTGTPADPFCSITEALQVAAVGETIFIAPGTYFENLQLDQDQQLVGLGGQSVTFLDGANSDQIVYISAGAEVLFEGLTFRNGLKSRGGGIEVRTSCRVSLVDSTVESCSAPGFMNRGGGIYGYDAEIILQNSTVSGNSSNGGGGIALFYNSDLRAYGSRLSGNDATRYGGAVYVDQSNARFVDSTLESNDALIGGAVYGWASSYVGLVTSTLTDNSGAGSAVGGGTATFHIENSTLSGNSGGRTIDASSGYTLLTNATVTDNHTKSAYDPYPGTIRSGVLRVAGSIVAGNLGGDVNGTILSDGHNLIGTGATGVVDGVNGDMAGTLVAPLDPMLAPLADNGGPTHTHALLPGSPALDAGASTDYLSTDQRGAARPFGASSDIGALEQGGAPEGLCSGNVQSCTACPCGNNAPSTARGGCLNSSGSSGTLLRSRSGSVSLGDLRFEAEQLPGGSFAVLLSGDSLAPLNPGNPCFGSDSGIQSTLLDGKRCIVGAVLRQGGRAVAVDGTIGSSNAGWGPPNTPFLGIAFQGGFSAGSTRYFQATYRDIAFGPCLTMLNTTQAIEVTFTP